VRPGWQGPGRAGPIAASGGGRRRLRRAPGRRARAACPGGGPRQVRLAWPHFRGGTLLLHAPPPRRSRPLIPPPPPAFLPPLPRQAESQLSQAGRIGRYAAAASGKKGSEEGPLNRICRDVGKLSAEQVGWRGQGPTFLGRGCQRGSASTECVVQAGTLVRHELPRGRALVRQGLRGLAAHAAELAQPPPPPDSARRRPALPKPLNRSRASAASSSRRYCSTATRCSRPLRPTASAAQQRRSRRQRPRPPWRRRAAAARHPWRVRACRGAPFTLKARPWAQACALASERIQLQGRCWARGLTSCIAKRGCCM
jgi:hypothetical protein